MRRLLLFILMGAAVVPSLGCGRDEPPAEAWQRVDAAAIPDELRAPRPGTRPVTMEPAGTWHVARTPRTFVTFQGIETDMALTLGVADGHQAMVYRDRMKTLKRLFFDQIPGFQMPLEDVVELSGARSIGREVFYDLNPDVFLVDPRLPLVYWGWEARDVASAASEIAPFFGNYIRKERGEQWGPAYQQYTLDEAFAIYAELFDREARYRRFAEFRDAFMQRLRDRLPPRDQRPKVMLLNAGSQPDKGKFYLVDLNADKGDGFAGTWIQAYRDLGLEQAYDFSQYAVNEWSQSDFESLAAIDPEVIIVVWSLAMYPTAEAFEREFVQPLRDHPIGRTLRAVRNDRVLPGGTAEQGPLTHLFQLEMMAKLVFPERFGQWRWGDEPDRPLFDRRELGRILADEPAVAANKEALP